MAFRYAENEPAIFRHDQQSPEENTSDNRNGGCSWDSEMSPEDEFREIEKPQLKFQPKVDNSEAPFKPMLRSKPNAIRPLNIHLEFDKNGTEYYCHPYLHELNMFRVPSCQLKKARPIPPSDINSYDTITVVDDEESLANMIADLRSANELALDSEYHSFRSFYGFLCVLQISTRVKDYVVDAIALRSKLEVLNEFFTDPKILKVMHASHSDVIWLQKDLNLYLVNMFDTSLAAIELGSRQSGLSSLLRQYCGIYIEKNKDFQKHFDWRTRPLPEEAIMYSRDDSHYLLNLYDILRNELLTKSNNCDSLMLVYDHSRDVCKKTFRKPSSESGLSALLRKCQKDYRKSHAMKSLYLWRDKICREMDESTGYVLPNRVLQHLVDTLPETVEDIDASFYPSDVPPIVQKRIRHLLDLINEAREQPTDGDPFRTTVKEIKKTRSQGTQTEDNVARSSRSTQTETRNEARSCSTSTQTEGSNNYEKSVAHRSTLHSDN